MKKIVRIGIVAILLLLVIIGYAWFSLFDKYVHPRRMQLNGWPDAYGYEWRDIEFETHDGYTLKAWFIVPPGIAPGEKVPAVLAVHGYGTNRWNIFHRTAKFIEAGYAVFTFDNRASGESGGSAVTGGGYEVRDTRKALQVLLQQPEVDPDRVAIYGFSMGAAVSIMTAAEESSIKAVIADSPFAGMREISSKILNDNGMPRWLFLPLLDLSFNVNFGFGIKDVDVEAAAAKLAPRPLLMFGGDLDTSVPVDQVKKVFESAKGDKKLIINPEGNHFGNASKKLFDEEIVPFLNRYIGPGASAQTVETETIEAAQDAA